MAQFKLVIANPKDGSCVQKEVKDEQARPLLGLKIGDTVKGDLLGLPGYEFLLAGGSDYCGFPMRKDIQGTGRRKIIAVSGVGFRAKDKGTRQRKTVCGNTIHERIVQVNLKVMAEGKDKLAAEKKEEAKKEAAAKPAKEKKD